MMGHQKNYQLRIVVPVLDEGDNLNHALHRLQILRTRGAQVVVVDGGSTDNTWAIAAAHADCVLLAPRGRASQMNKGLQHSDDSPASVVLFLHADTRLPDNADTLIFNALDLGHSWGRFDVRIDGPERLLRIVAGMMNLRSRITGIATGDQAIFVQKSALNIVDGLTDMPLMEDIDLSSRLGKLGKPACLRAHVMTSARRWQKNGVWRTIMLMWRLRWAYFFGANPQVLAQQYGYTPRPVAAHISVAILAKAPIAGLAKTRLIPLLGAQAAARAQRQFIHQTHTVASQAAPGRVSIWCAPDASHPCFRVLHRLYGTPCFVQVQADLGARMLQAFTHHFAQYPQQPMLLVGTDCAVLAPGHLQQAAQALKHHDVVLIPAEDGGYVLIGMRQLVPSVFEDIVWSTPQVLRQTRQQLRRAGVTWHEISSLWDVDEPADWHRWTLLKNPHDNK